MTAVAIPGVDNAPTTHGRLLSWVREVAELTTPDRVVWVDGTDVRPYGIRDTSRVSGSASKSNSPLTPATSEAEGSKPSGGRLNVVFCDWEIAVKLICPRAPAGLK